MHNTVESGGQISVAETVLAAILHYSDRCRLLEERVAETLQLIRSKDVWTEDDVRGCMHEIDVVRGELNDLVIYSRRWEYSKALRPIFTKHLEELRLLKEAFRGIALLASP